MSIATGSPVGGARTRLDVAPADLPTTAERLLADGFRVALVAAHDDGDALRAVYLFTAVRPDRRIELVVRLDRSRPRVPSLAELSFPAGRFEREMHDLFGIVPDGHPLPRRLVRHFHWPKGWHPLRSDAGDPPPFGDVDGPFPFRTVEGDGVYEIPVGPVHAGLIEPGHFRFSVVGETILKLKARLWFVHRGLERLFQGRQPSEGVELAERVSGDTSVGHALAYCLAVEDALGLEVAEEVARRRALLLELERIHNHVADIGALCKDVGHAILDTHALRVRERLLRINATVTGHRLLRGAIGVGRADVRDLPDPAELAAIGREVAEIVDLALSHSVVRDRFAGTAVLHRQQALDLGTLGYVARASGVDVDARRDHPTTTPGLAFTVHTAQTAHRLHAAPGGGPAPEVEEGDVLARFLVRAAEIRTSVAMVGEFLGHDRPDLAPVVADVRPPGEPGSGVGIVEAWRGTVTHRVELAADGRLRRVKIVDPSFFNWPALPVALADTIVPDFPLVNKSFNLSYAGNDL